MTLIDIDHNPEREATDTSSREIVNKYAQYNIEHFTEQSNPELAEYVQQMQGECYVRFGFVYPSALDEKGRLFPELDRSRGESVTYYLARPRMPRDGIVNEGSLRIADIPEGGSIHDLAAFHHSAATMYEGVEEALVAYAEQGGPGSVREVMALSNTENADPFVSFELIRHITQEAIRDNSNEMWIINFVPHAYEAIRAQYGDMAVKKISSVVAIDVNDARTSDTLRLVPVIIEPCRVLDQIVEHLSKPELTPNERAKVARSLLFLLDGLEADELSDHVKQTASAIAKGEL